MMGLINPTIFEIAKLEHPLQVHDRSSPRDARVCKKKLAGTSEGAVHELYHGGATMRKKAVFWALGSRWKGLSPRVRVFRVIMKMRLMNHQ